MRVETPQSFVVREECEKAAWQNGFRRPVEGVPGWAGFASTTVPGAIHLAAGGPQGPWYLALDHNRTLVHLMAQMLEPQPGESIYDPTCGTGGMLISCLAEVKRRGGDIRTTGLYGQELITITAAIARMNLVIHGVDDFHIASGNTLATPAFVQGDRLRTFDVVLANPPYSIKKWNRGAWEQDAWGRNFLGTPPQGRADYAFLQHILSSMDPKTGRCAILFPHGVLFRNEEAEMRRRLVESDRVECVLGLGPGLFYNSPMEACVVICRSQKPEARKGRILFIDAVAEIARERAQSFLRPDHQALILSAYHAFADQPGFATVASVADVLAADGNLSIARYVKRPKAVVAGGGATLAATWAAFDEDGRDFWTGMDALVDMLDGLTPAETIELIHENVHVDAVRDDLDTLVLDAELLEAVLGNPDPEKKAKEISVKLAGRLRKHTGNPKFKALGERLEDLKNRHQQGLLHSIDFLKELLALAKDVVRTERETPEDEDIDRGKAALTALFEEARNGDTPVMVKRVVDDIDAIVREVRFEGWQATHAGEREVKKALRQTLFKYKLHQDAELFEKAYGYIREYY